MLDDRGNITGHGTDATGNVTGHSFSEDMFLGCEQPGPKPIIFCVIFAVLACFLKVSQILIGN